MDLISTTFDYRHTPRLWDYHGILDALQKIAPEAHIAGGAVRDNLLEKPIADIDVFTKDKHVVEAAALLCREYGYVKTKGWREHYLFSAPPMTRVAKFEKSGETIPICLVGVLPEFANPKDNIARFDFGICMAAFDGKRDIIRTAEFEQDVKAHTFTLCHADNRGQFAYSLHRFRKITATRYNDWSLVIPGKFAWLMRDAFSDWQLQDVDDGLPTEPPEAEAA